MSGVLIFWYEKLKTEILVATCIIYLINIIRKVFYYSEKLTWILWKRWAVIGCRVSSERASKNDILIITIIGEGDWQTDRHSGRPALSDNMYLETYHEQTKLLKIFKVRNHKKLGPWRWGFKKCGEGKARRWGKFFFRSPPLTLTQFFGGGARCEGARGLCEKKWPRFNAPYTLNTQSLLYHQGITKKIYTKKNFFAIKK